MSTSVLSLVAATVFGADPKADKKQFEKLEDAPKAVQDKVDAALDTLNKVETRDHDHVTIDPKTKKFAVNETRFTAYEKIKGVLGQIKGLVEKTRLDNHVTLQRKVAEKVAGQVNEATAHMERTVITPSDAPKEGPGSASAPLKPTKEDFLFHPEDKDGIKFGSDENVSNVVRNDGKVDPKVRLIPTGFRNSVGFPETFHAEKGIQFKKMQYMYYTDPYTGQTRLGTYVELEETGGATNKFLVTEGARFRTLVLLNYTQDDKDKSDDKAILGTRKISVREGLQAR